MSQIKTSLNEVNYKEMGISKNLQLIELELLPVAVVQDPYTNIGVRKAPRQQSKGVALHNLLMICLTFHSIIVYFILQRYICIWTLVEYKLLIVKFSMHIDIYL